MFPLEGAHELKAIIDVVGFEADEVEASTWFRGVRLAGEVYKLGQRTANLSEVSFISKAPNWKYQERIVKSVYVHQQQYGLLPKCGSVI